MGYNPRKNALQEEKSRVQESFYFRSIMIVTTDRARRRKGNTKRAPKKRNWYPNHRQTYRQV